jgi:hypothetical protein
MTRMLGLGLQVLTQASSPDGSNAVGGETEVRFINRLFGLYA